VAHRLHPPALKLDPDVDIVYVGERAPLLLALGLLGWSPDQLILEGVEGEVLADPVGPGAELHEVVGGWLYSALFVSDKSERLISFLSSPYRLHWFDRCWQVCELGC
jgi:hypothetical protein